MYLIQISLNVAVCTQSERRMWGVVQNLMTLTVAEDLWAPEGRYKLTCWRRKRKKWVNLGPLKKSVFLAIHLLSFFFLKTNVTHYTLQWMWLNNSWEVACNKLINVKKMIDSWGSWTQMMWNSIFLKWFTLRITRL